MRLRFWRCGDSLVKEQREGEMWYLSSDLLWAEEKRKVW